MTNLPFGVGVDIVSITRVAEKLKLNKSSLKKWFFPREIDYCMSKSNPKLHFAGRFAAKEAVIKALSQAINLILVPNDIEIIGDGKSAPKARLHSKTVKDYEIQVSISYTNEIAIAIAISIISQYNRSA